MANDIDFSVAICTYNGAQRLPLVLERLRSQALTHPCRWEVIVVDNNSSDQTPAVVASYQTHWPQSISLRYEFEARQGLGFARQRAVETAQGHWVGFLDDDNPPNLNWVDAAYQFGQTHPQAGVYGSRIQGCYETPPPAHFDRISRFLAIGGSSRLRCYSHPDYEGFRKRVYPPGAGAVVRRSAWLTLVPKNLTLQGRVSGLELPGEDVEAFSYLRAGGWEIWHNPAMVIEHHIPQQRLQAAYLRKLLWRTGLSRFYTRRLGYPPILFMGMLPLFGLNDVCKLIGHCCRYPLWRRDRVLDGEKLLLLGSLVSPFHGLWRWFQYQLSRIPETSAGQKGGSVSLIHPSPVSPTDLPRQEIASK